MINGERGKKGGEGSLDRCSLSQSQFRDALEDQRGEGGRRLREDDPRGGKKSKKCSARA